MTIVKLQALARGTAGNSTGDEVANAVNALIDKTDILDGALSKNITVTLSKYAHLVRTLAGGADGDYLSAVSQLFIIVDEVDETDLWDITVTLTGGIEGILVDSTYVVTGLSSPQGTVIFKATREDYPTFIQTFTVMKFDIQDTALPQVEFDGTELIVDHENAGTHFILTNSVSGCRVQVNPAVIEGEPAPASHIMFTNETSEYCYFVDHNDDPIPAAYGNSFAAYGVGVALISRGTGWRLYGATA